MSEQQEPPVLAHPQPPSHWEEVEWDNKYDMVMYRDQQTGEYIARCTNCFYEKVGLDEDGVKRSAINHFANRKKHPCSFSIIRHSRKKKKEKKEKKEKKRESKQEKDDDFLLSHHEDDEDEDEIEEVEESTKDMNESIEHPIRILPNRGAKTSRRNSDVTPADRPTKRARIESSNDTKKMSWTDYLLCYSLNAPAVVRYATMNKDSVVDDTMGVFMRFFPVAMALPPNGEAPKKEHETPVLHMFAPQLSEARLLILTLLELEAFVKRTFDEYPRVDLTQISLPQLDALAPMAGQHFRKAMIAFHSASQPNTYFRTRWDSVTEGRRITAAVVGYCEQLQRDMDTLIQDDGKRLDLFLILLIAELKYVSLLTRFMQVCFTMAGWRANITPETRHAVDYVLRQLAFSTASVKPAHNTCTLCAQPTMITSGRECMACQIRAAAKGELPEYFTQGILLGRAALQALLGNLFPNTLRQFIAEKHEMLKNIVAHVPLFNS
jgi:hypothetical protein